MDPGYASYPRRGPNTASIVFLSIFTSVLASATTVVLIERFDLVERLSGKRAATTVEVPGLTTMARTTADEVLASRGLRLIVSGEREHEADKGTVIEQQPLAGSRVQQGDAIMVTLSAGSTPQVEVPAVIAKTEDVARGMLVQAGLVVGEVASGGEGEPGIVSSAEPAPGALVAPGSSITLTVARDEKIAVPKLKDMHVREAKEKLAELGLAVGDVKERYDRRKRGYLVLRQSPKPGTEVDEQTPVDLVINQGD